MAANSFLVAADKIHSNEPFDEWQLCILEDSTYEARKVLVALCAVETSVLGHLAVMFTTIRANNVLLLTDTPTTLNDGLLALLVRSEIRCERDNVVELLEINYNTELFFYTENLRKVQRLWGFFIRITVYFVPTAILLQKK